MAALESSAKLRIVAPPLPMIAPQSGVGTSSRSCVLFPSRASMDSATACANMAHPALRTAVPCRPTLPGQPLRGGACSAPLCCVLACMHPLWCMGKPVETL